ncbi:MarR family transcriptional regulator [Oscillospiraceae bacterium 44-34]
MEELSFQQFITAVNRMYKMEEDLYRRLARHSGLSDAAFWVLYSIRTAPGPVTQTDIGGTLMLSKQTINSALKQLEQSSHICLTSGPGRKKYLQLTEKGQVLADRAIRPTLEVERGAFLGMSEEERASLLALERKYLSLLLRESEQIFQSSQEE